MSTEDPRGDWGEWTPGKGVERIRTEMPGVMPDLTEEDYAAAKAIIAAAGGSTVNRELTVVLPKLSDADAAEWAARFREAMRHPQRLIFLSPDEDERERAAYARGISEGQRLRAEKLDALTRGAYEDGRGDGRVEGRRQATEALEAPGSLLCDCEPDRDYDGTSRPTNPSTGQPMDHHCDCAAVDAAATLLGDGAKTRHAAQCACSGPHVGPWEPAERDEQPPVQHARGCACGVNDAGDRFTDLICRRQ